MPSKDLAPRKEAFFPKIFLRNQFRDKRPPLPQGLDLSGQTIVITGGNTGLGFESAGQLLKLKLSNLILAVRSKEKGDVAAKSLSQQCPRANIAVWPLDMSSYESIQAFARRAEKELPRLDAVILNAGVHSTKHSIVPSTGHEETMQVNYISTTLLSILMLPVLKAKAPRGGPGKLTIVGSGLALAATVNPYIEKPEAPVLKMHDGGSTFNFNDPYNDTKLLLCAFLWRLAEYVPGEDVVVNCVDPGFVKGTELQRGLSKMESVGMKAFASLTGRTPEEGASTYVDAAVVKGRESHGSFLMSWQVEAFPKLLYSPEGSKLVEKVWQETMDELRFANVQGIVESMRK